LFPAASPSIDTVPGTAGLEALREEGQGKMLLVSWTLDEKHGVVFLSLLAMIGTHTSQTILTYSFLFRASLDIHLQPNFFVVNSVRVVK